MLLQMTMMKIMKMRQWKIKVIIIFFKIQLKRKKKKKANGVFGDYLVICHLMLNEPCVICVVNLMHFVKNFD